MKRVSAMSSALLIALMTSLHIPAQERHSMIGADLTAGLTESRLAVILGYAFSERWSAEGHIGLALGHLAKGKNGEETAHENEFGTEEKTRTCNEETFGDTGSISICYWAAKAYSGSFISIGGRYSNGHDPDLIFGTGYVIPVWKGISATISFSIDMIETYRNGSIMGDGISIAICYVF